MLKHTLECIITKNVFGLMYRNKQARSLYTGQRNLYAQAAQYIQNTTPHRTAPHRTASASSNFPHLLPFALSPTFASLIPIYDPLCHRASLLAVALQYKIRTALKRSRHYFIVAARSSFRRSPASTRSALESRRALVDLLILLTTHPKPWNKPQLFSDFAPAALSCLA